MKLFRNEGLVKNLQSFNICINPEKQKTENFETLELTNIIQNSDSMKDKIVRSRICTAQLR